MKIVSIIGARPQIIKSAAITRYINENLSDEIEEVVLHTGQHYDENMSGQFFKELNLPQPVHNLHIGGMSNADQVAEMMNGISNILEKEKPNAVLVYGDTNSTLAGSLAANYAKIPLVHIEAGLRSFDKDMPEEVNRIISDQMSTLLFSPTHAGILNLKNEGFSIEINEDPDVNYPNVYHCGDIMYDNAIYYGDKASERDVISQFGLHNDFILATVHRPQNTDDPNRLNHIFRALYRLVSDRDMQLVLPLHPRTSSALEESLDKQLLEKIRAHEEFKLVEPLGYLEMIQLQKRASLVITDSGGVQKEAYFFKNPCLILRPVTEWKEIVENGNAVLCDADEDKIIRSYDVLKNKIDFTFPSLFGDGDAAKFICNEILSKIKC
ncbi:UDP-N-acetylglucosamine 2-epimerase (non-hydrolyzing) [Paracrocinitomix mangrovi]|uniref:non-hydrolyzing UDP-N-acetylglucosamine 2-epimerase n=1 Tax=Paracrocinitomix mangrovi TaxID=2862509 RepID=UPI001C8E5264|nr:UDP-N-acetylglucosamine 2-epimerase (non-hydrolyzing) [Paracrocinitomix mangrovi]UKN01815.1 UDP-N-acetylglucosamine 2-epimerase (non-hydrolyzing) [Paracrocinitomix mangrovi]